MNPKPTLIKLTILATALLLCVGLWWLGQGRAPAPQVAPQAQTTFGPLPEVTLMNTTGQPFAGWQSLPQPALLITFWASWCSVCMAELPAKLVYAQTHPHVALIAISTDTDATAMQRAMQRVMQRLNAPQLSNILWLQDTTQTAAKAFQISGVPETFVANANREILAKQNGPIRLKWGPIANALEDAQH